MEGGSSITRESGNLWRCSRDEFQWALLGSAACCLATRHNKEETFSRKIKVVHGFVNFWNSLFLFNLIFLPLCPSNLHCPFSVCPLLFIVCKKGGSYNSYSIYDTEGDFNKNYILFVMKWMDICRKIWQSYIFSARNDSILGHTYWGNQHCIGLEPIRLAAFCLTRGKKNNHIQNFRSRTCRYWAASAWCVPPASGSRSWWAARTTRRRSAGCCASPSAQLSTGLAISRFCVLTPVRYSPPQVLIF